MAQNIAPVFALVPNQQWAKLTAANTAMDGTGTCPDIFTGHATDGSRVDGIRACSLGTNVATVLRVFQNNGSTAATPTNNSLIAQFELPATTADNAKDVGTLFLPLHRPLKAGHKLMICIGTAVATGWQFTGEGGHLAA